MMIHQGMAKILKRDLKFTKKISFSSLIHYRMKLFNYLHNIHKILKTHFLFKVRIVMVAIIQEFDKLV